MCFTFSSRLLFDSARSLSLALLPRALGRHLVSKIVTFIWNGECAWSDIRLERENYFATLRQGLQGKKFHINEEKVDPASLYRALLGDPQEATLCQSTASSSASQQETANQLTELVGVLTRAQITLNVCGLLNFLNIESNIEQTKIKLRISFKFF